jgi:hypothetical protein
MAVEDAAVREMRALFADYDPTVKDLDEQVVQRMLLAIRKDIERAERPVVVFTIGRRAGNVPVYLDTRDVPAASGGDKFMADVRKVRAEHDPHREVPIILVNPSVPFTGLKCPKLPWAE